jgi:hypothetical protein
MNRKMRIGLGLAALLVWGFQAGNAFAADEHNGRPEPRPEARGPAPGHPSGPGPGRPGPSFAPGRPGPGPGRPSFDGRGQVLDGRYNHGRYYPPVGTVSRSLPGEYRPYYRGRDRYYFNGGIWYAPQGPGFVVVRPPSGLVISVLPPFYSTVWFGGNPYYYADNVYYTWQPDQNGYAVVDPPPDADAPAPPPDSPQEDVIIYPKNGQSKEQQSADQFECHNWARSQTGFDPTQGAGGGVQGNADASRNNYNRAMSACLQGRGYQVN